MSHNEDSPAFPIVHPDGSGVQYFGMTLRDYFAGQFICGRSAVPGIIDPGYDARLAYQVADAMLAERMK